MISTLNNLSLQHHKRVVLIISVLNDRENAEKTFVVNKLNYLIIFAYHDKNTVKFKIYIQYIMVNF